MEDFLYICDDAYKRKEFLDMERVILKAIGFDIGMPLSYRFLRRYAKVGSFLHCLLIFNKVLIVAMCKVITCIRLSQLGFVSAFVRDLQYKFVIFLLLFDIKIG